MNFQNIDDIDDKKVGQNQEIGNSGMKYSSDMKIYSPDEEGIQMGNMVNNGYGVASRDSKIDDMQISAPKIIDDNDKGSLFRERKSQF